MPTDILAALDADCGPDVAHAFSALAVEYLAATRDPTSRVSTPHSRTELAARFAEPLPRRGRPISEIIGRLRDEVLPDCNHLYHPRYIGHQVSAPLPAAIWMESLTAALNQSIAVWEMSPVGTVLEHQVIRGRWRDTHHRWHGSHVYGAARRARRAAARRLGQRHH
jgi:L-2,4-diaminobutyrate decarboxylase